MTINKTTRIGQIRSMDAPVVPIADKRSVPISKIWF